MVAMSVYKTASRFLFLPPADPEISGNLDPTPPPDYPGEEQHAFVVGADNTVCGVPLSGLHEFPKVNWSHNGLSCPDCLELLPG